MIFYILLLLLMLLFVVVMTLILLSAFLGFLITRVPFVPTSSADIELVVKKLPVTAQDMFYDLGSGDGKVIFEVERLSGAKVKGFELTLWTHIWAKLKKFFKHSKAELSNHNFFHEDWSGATVIYGYLYPPLMGRIEEKFKAECKPGTFAVIRDFPLPNLKPVEILNPPPLNRTPIADTKWNRFKILLRSLWRAGKPMNHEIYIYRL